MQKKLYVGGLSYNTDVDQVRELFVQAGEVVSANIIKDKFTNQSRGFGFVEMATEEQAAEAIKMFMVSKSMDEALQWTNPGSGKKEFFRWKRQRIQRKKQTLVNKNFWSIQTLGCSGGFFIWVRKLRVRVYGIRRFFSGR